MSSDELTVLDHTETIVDSVLPFIFAGIGVWMGWSLGWWAVGLSSVAVGTYYGFHLCTAFAFLWAYRRAGHR